MSSCLEANKSMAHSELIQVWGHRARLCHRDPAVPWAPHCAMGTLSVPWGPHCAVGTPPCPSAPISPQNFLNSGSCPEVQGFLQLREAGRKVWKRFYFSLRRSGLYYSTKGTSKVRAQAGARPGGCSGAGPDSPPPHPRTPGTSSTSLTSPSPTSTT